MRLTALLERSRARRLARFCRRSLLTALLPLSFLGAAEWILEIVDLLFEARSGFREASKPGRADPPTDGARRARTVGSRD